jgi:hypothetical protein
MALPCWQIQLLLVLRTMTRGARAAC